jgi:hypothetical protein
MLVGSHRLIVVNYYELYIGLYSLDNHLIGVLNISFKESHKITRDEWILIRQKAGVIGTLLSEYLYATTTKKK